MAPVYKTEITAVGIRHAYNATTLYSQKLTLSSPTNGGHLFGIVCSRTKASELSYDVGFNPSTQRHDGRLIYDLYT
jgi:hypothetical protein